MKNIQFSSRTGGGQLIDSAEAQINHWRFYPKSQILTPIQSISIALLTDAMNVLETKKDDDNSRRQRANDLKWINTNDNEYIFSFVSCCDHLGLDVEYSRALILKRLGDLE